MSGGKKRWAHRGPKSKGNSSKQSNFAKKQEARRNRVNAAVTARRQEIEQLASAN